MVWGCISWEGPGRLHRIEGRMTGEVYCDILTESLLGSLSDKKTSPRAIIFQQDNDSKHTSRRAKAWFDENGGLTRANGEKFRREVLSKGDRVPLLANYAAFRGKQPDVAHLLARHRS